MSRSKIEPYQASASCFTARPSPTLTLQCTSCTSSQPHVALLVSAVSSHPASPSPASDVRTAFSLSWWWTGRRGRGRASWKLEGGWILKSTREIRAGISKQLALKSGKDGYSPNTGIAEQDGTGMEGAWGVGKSEGNWRRRGRMDPKIYPGNPGRNQETARV